MNRELLMLVDAISREKSVDLEIVFQAVEAALASASKKLHGGEVDMRVSVDRETGEYETFRRWHVVPNEAGLQLPDSEVLHFEAVEQIADIEVDDYIEEQIESVSIGRIGAQAAKQVILQKIRDAEREQLLTDFLSRGEKIFVGTVKRLDKGDVIVESGRIEGRLRRSRDDPEGKPAHRRPRPRLHRRGRPDPARAADPAVAQRRRGFMIELFAQEVPEIEQKLLEIKSCARDPGSRAKIAVQSRTTSGSIRSAPASACAARASTPSPTSSPASASTSCSGRRTRRSSSSARWRRPTCSRSSSTRSATRWTSWSTRRTSRSPSAAAARTCASPPR